MTPEPETETEDPATGAGGRPRAGDEASAAPSSADGGGAAARDPAPSPKHGHNTNAESDADEDADDGPEVDSAAAKLLADAASNLRGPQGPADPFAASSAGGVSAGFHGTTIHATTVVLGSQVSDSDIGGPEGPGLAGRRRAQAGDGGPGHEDDVRRRHTRSGRWTKIPPDAVTWTATAFARPSCYEAGSHQLERLNLAMLTGRPGFGRPSFAVAALSQLVVREKIYRIDAQIDLGTIDFSGLPKDSGFLIENFDTRLLNGGAVRFDRLADDFRSRGSYLVLTGRPQSGLLDVNRYIVDAREPASAAEIFKAQYLWFRDNPDGWTVPPGNGTRLPADPLADENVAAMLDTVVRVGQRSGVITELARRLAQAGLSDDVRRWVDGHLGDRFTQWISRLSDPDEIAFVLALAILNGLPYRLVAQVAEDFAQDLRTVAADRRRARGGDHGRDRDRDNNRDPDRGNERDRDRDEVGTTAGFRVLGPGRAALLAGAGAEIFEGTEDSGYGLAPVEAVRFATEGYARRVLDWVWREHVHLHDPLTAWLDALSHHPVRQVRTRVGAAAGLLGTHGFDQVRRTMLLQWTDTPRQREAVVSALRVLSGESEFAGHARRLALDWGTHSRHLGRQLTAVQAWGSGIGAETPMLALDALADCVETLPQPHTVDPLLRKFFGGGSLARAVVVNLLQLSTQGEAHAAAVLERIAEWSTAEDPRLRAVAAEGFLLLAARGVAIDHEAGWVRPLPLMLAMRGTAIAERVAALARHAFDTPYLYERAAEILRGWYARAEDDPELAAVLAEVVIRIPRDEEDEQLLADLVERWEPEFPKAVNRTFTQPD